MKKTFTIFVLALMAMCNTFTACGDDNDDGSENPEKPSCKINDNNIVGVWKTDNNFFVSFSSDKYNSTLLNNKFIDEGDYRIEKDTIFVENNYFGKTTKYVVNSIGEGKINITITYDDRWDGKKKIKMQLTKSSDTPCSKYHNLVGKSFYAQYDSKGGGKYWNKVFNTYNTISCTNEDVVSSDPSTFYFIYLPPRIYFYVFQNGEFRYQHVRYDDVVIGDNGQISSMGYLYGKRL